MTGRLVGWPFRKLAAEVRDTRLLASDRCHVIFLGSNELHEGAMTPVVGVGPFAHDARKGQAAGCRALVMELFVSALGEVIARAPPYQEAGFCFLDALEVGNACADSASDAPRELNPVCGDVEHRHEHLVVLIGSLGLLPSTWTCCIEPRDRLTRARVVRCSLSVALATWHLKPSDAEMGPGQAFGEGD